MGVKDPVALSGCWHTSCVSKRHSCRFKSILNDYGRNVLNSLRWPSKRINSHWCLVFCLKYKLGFVVAVLENTQSSGHQTWLNVKAFLRRSEKSSPGSENMRKYYSYDILFSPHLGGRRAESVSGRWWLSNNRSLLQHIAILIILTLIFLALYLDQVSEVAKGFL